MFLSSMTNIIPPIYLFVSVYVWNVCIYVYMCVKEVLIFTYLNISILSSLTCLGKVSALRLLRFLVFLVYLHLQVFFFF